MLAVRQRVTSQTLIETKHSYHYSPIKNETSQSGFFYCKKSKNKFDFIILLTHNEILHFRQ